MKHSNRLELLHGDAELAPSADGPEVMGLVAAGRLLGMGRTKAYRLARAGQFPCRVLRVGGRYVVPVRGVRALLGYINDRDGEGRLGSEREKG
ncbi:helix-turn-helix domain-containing protein [Nonomuraea sp. CA-141351]|uniref:helix-turn-helix domain-containing protein n=1 Tax=Nonomuraea sp. CA-141351 TaxID=3239996 RepID=UPI003D8EE139